MIAAGIIYKYSDIVRVAVYIIIPLKYGTFNIKHP